MIVEAIGPTASGKTTVVNAAIAELRVRGVMVRTAHQVVLGPLDRLLLPAGPIRAMATQVATLPFLIVAIVRQPRLAQTLMAVSWRHGERLGFRLTCLRNAARRLGVEGAIRRADRRAGPAEVIVVDEGLAHFVDMLAESGRAPSVTEVSDYARDIPAPALILRIQAPLHVRVRRIQSIGHRRLRSRTSAQVEGYARNGEVASDLLTQVLGSRTRVVVIEVGDGQDSLVEAVRMFCDAVKQSLSGALPQENSEGGEP